jgi:hypothetical protein
VLSPARSRPVQILPPGDVEIPPQDIEIAVALHIDRTDQPTELAAIDQMYGPTTTAAVQVFPPGDVKLAGAQYIEVPVAVHIRGMNRPGGRIRGVDRMPARKWHIDRPTAANIR